MSNSSNLTMFSHIVSRLSGRTEDVAVEALGFILSRSDSARRALRDMLRDILQEEGLSIPELTDAATQISGEEGARPDLVVWDQDRAERVLIEAKFWAGLTENQPNTYLARLPHDEHPAILLFVAPESRLETLWPAIQRIVDPSFDWLPLDTPNGAQVKCARVGEGRRFLVLASWRALLNRMLSFSLSSGDPVEADIKQLNALCEQQDQEAFLPLKQHDLAPGIARRLLQFNDLVDKAVENAKLRKIADTKGLRRTPASYGYGRYLRLGSKNTEIWAGAWLGLNYENWIKIRETPLWLWIDSGATWEGVVTIAEARARLGNDIWANTPDWIPVHLPIGVEEDKVLDEIVDQLQEIAQKIATP
ncbi:MAG: hypothetical protein F4181_03155 [Proteobacteria bacterium]|nr:hypothetical protein [Pseudomonadota bacterium]